LPAGVTAKKYPADAQLLGTARQLAYIVFEPGLEATEVMMQLTSKRL
jgi:hypothetical protein